MLEATESTVNPFDRAALEQRFRYHSPKGDQPERYERIRSEAKNLAIAIAALCPKSREFLVAMERLDEVVFWANASIARNE